MAYRGFRRDRRVVIGILKDVFGEENVFASHAEFLAAEDARKRREAEAERQLRRQFEYELAVLKKVAADEGLAAAAAGREGNEEEARDCAFRAWHVGSLVRRGEESGQRVWAWDVVGKCLLEARVVVPDSFMSSVDLRELIEEAARRV
jgi:hypothetical protein